MPGGVQSSQEIGGPLGESIAVDPVAGGGSIVVPSEESARVGHAADQFGTPEPEFDHRRHFPSYRVPGALRPVEGRRDRLHRISRTEAPTQDVVKAGLKCPPIARDLSLRGGASAREYDRGLNCGARQLRSLYSWRAISNDEVRVEKISGSDMS